jgi:hypothetical protein
MKNQALGFDARNPGLCVTEGFTDHWPIALEQLHTVQRTAFFQAKERSGWRGKGMPFVFWVMGAALSCG